MLTILGELNGVGGGQSGMDAIATQSSHNVYIQLRLHVTSYHVMSRRLS
jgi:hypothetical protein